MGTSETQVRIVEVVAAAPTLVVAKQVSVSSGGSFSEKLAAALGIVPVTPPGPIQVIFNRYKKHLDGRTVDTPLPEKVHLLAENFPYWIKLAYPDLANPGILISAKASVVIPLLEKRQFDETGFQIDESRANALFNIMGLLGQPDCIHKNLRNHAHRGDGGIKGDHMYVRYHGRRTRRVAFTRFDPKLGKVILVSSFAARRQFAEECAHMPPIYVRPGFNCTCGPK